MPGLAFPILSFIVFFPLLGVLVVSALPSNALKTIRVTSIFFTSLPLALTILLWANFDIATSNFQFLERYSWISALGISYLIGVDGISLPMIFLTTLLFVITMVYSFGIAFRHKEFYALMLLLEVGLLGVFVSLDLFVFFVFWEIVLIPMYFLISIWGGPRKDYSAIKFFLYTHLGSLVMLLGFIALYFEASPTLTATIGGPSASMIDIGGISREFTIFFQLLVFAAFFLAYGIKIPLVPVHTWLPDAHVEAPTEGSVILAAILLKMGLYGLIRVAITLLPVGALAFAPMMALIGIISILYGAFISIAQKDLKKMIAYSSISHMGMAILGLSAFNTIGFSGAVFMMFAHGLYSAALFMMSGSIHHATGTRLIPKLGGIASKMPIGAFMLAASAFAAAGIPGMAGFIAEFSVFLGAFATFNLWVMIPILYLVITAGYFLWALQKSIFGPFNEKLGSVKDLRLHEILPLTVLVVFLIIFGVFPGLIMDMIGITSGGLLTQIGGR